MSMGKHSCGEKLHKEIRGPQSSTCCRSSARKEHTGLESPKKMWREGGVGLIQITEQETLILQPGGLVGQTFWK